MRIRRAPGFPSARLLDLLIRTRQPFSLIGTVVRAPAVLTNHEPCLFVCLVQDLYGAGLVLAVGGVWWCGGRQALRAEGPRS